MPWSLITSTLRAMKLVDDSVSPLPLLAIPDRPFGDLLVGDLPVLLVADGEVGENDAAVGDAEAEAEAEVNARAEGVDGRGMSSFRTETRLDRCGDPAAGGGVVVKPLVMLSSVCRCMSELDSTRVSCMTDASLSSCARNSLSKNAMRSSFRSRA